MYRKNLDRSVFDTRNNGAVLLEKVGHSLKCADITSLFIHKKTVYNRDELGSGY